VRISVGVNNWRNNSFLQKYFGIIRGAGGCEDHPTVSSFLQLHRLLSFYTPCKKLLTGNIRSDDKVTVLASFRKTLKSKAEALQRKKCDWKIKTEEILFQKLQMSNPSELEVPIHSTLFGKYGDSQADALTVNKEDKFLVYHLVGYLVTKASKLLQCQACSFSLERPSDHFGFVPEDGKLTEIRDINSSLRHPSIDFYNIFLHEVEPVVSQMLKSGDFYGDVLTRVLESLGTLNDIKFGCSEPGHFELILIKMIPFYITLRFQLYSRNVKRDGHGVLTKNRRKEAKVVSK